MGQAWLDSLSEDWVSQAGSDAFPADQLTASQPHHDASSKLPRSNNLQAAAAASKKLPYPTTAHDTNSSGVLSERSVNELLTSPSRRLSSKIPSKLSCEIKVNNRGRLASRSYSDSVSGGSVVHNTVHHKSLSTSPSKGRHDTPEWKRRLVYGQLPYGEQPDLFTSATTGLENMFKPPAPAPRAPEDDSYQEDLSLQHDATLPSSPPHWARDPSTAEIHVDESLQALPGPPDRRPQTSMRCRQVQDSEEPSMTSDASVAHDSRTQAYSTTEQTAYSANQPNHLDAESRKVSGRSDVRHEDFSPILLERRQASNGKQTFGPADLPPQELRRRLETLRRNQMLVTGDHEESGGDGRDATTDLERLGGFINFRRGGRSADDSFRHRNLSSGMNDTSELNPEESLQASTPKQFPTVRMEPIEESDLSPAHSPDLPRPPNPSPFKRTQGSAGSPLKLFQPYDTFTNQTLLRRLSQFQGDSQDLSGTADFDQSLSDAAAVRQRVNQRWEEEEALHRGNPDDSVNQFGTGQFNGYEFQDEYSYQSHEASVLPEERESRTPEEDPVQAPHQRIFDLSHNSSPAEDAPSLVVPRKRGKSLSGSSRRSSRASASDKLSLHPPFPNLAESLCTPKRRDRTSEIKRPRTSPCKESTPKRRRTLHKTDISYVGPEQAQSVQDSHLQMQSMIGRKRKDSRDSEQLEMAEEDMLASRHLLRPRTPTPTQRSSVQRERPLSAGEKSALRSSRKSQASNAAHLSASQTERKPSIKTEDFINEANKIMAMIRSKAGVASGLASLEESDAEYVQQASPDMDSSYQESTQEPFSRPPSREGARPVTRISTRQEDPEVAERLKRYEEASDMGDIIGSSIRSTVLAEEAIRAARERHEAGGTTGSNSTRPSIWDGDVISDPPNIRISHKPNWQSAGDVDSGAPSHASTGSQSTGRSIPTGSSRGSETKKVIAPESVLHLIPDQVGNMVLDKQNNIWIKRRAASVRSKRRNSYMPSEASEDDPFADIPDLTVDMTLEMQNLRLMTAQKEAAARDALADESSPVRPTEPSGFDSSRISAMDETPSATPLGQHRQPSTSPVDNTAAPTNDESEQVEHEISINEDRVDPRKRRNLTISFSSPIASIIQDRLDDETQGADDIPAHDESIEELMQESIKRGRRTTSIQNKLKTASSRSRSRSLGPARRLSVRGQTFVARPISRIDERDEESVLDRIKNQQRQVNNMELSIVAENSVVSNDDGDVARQTSLSFVMRTPARSQDCPLMGVDAAPIISQYVGTYSLSPLSEFTMHHGEETMPLEASYVVGDHRLVTGDRSKRVMSMNTRELVGKIAEVEPFEPYWDDMRDLELSNKRLESLHNLDEFCSCLERLDVSNNEIRNLNGIPTSVRHLKMTNNQLTGLTAWGHLMNLQYVDVSNNGLTSLSAFKNLVHLRSLRVDNNQLTNLDGIKFHDGLQSLRARGNAIEELDFDGNRLDQLTDLDLKNNKISHISNLDQLPVLDSLNLEGNQLSAFAIESSSPLLSLRYLRLDDNKLTTLDVKLLPHLRLLHADRNCLARISGFSRARRIDSLSLREQHGAAPLDMRYILARAYEVRKLYLSGNYVEALAPTVDLLNLQLLELANCGLQSLPADLGLMLPNLRAVNLNMNAIADLAPLRYVPRLKRVLVSGNRLADAAALVEVLGGFGHLREVDVRDNPVTQGFYGPVTQVVVRAAAATGDGEEEGGKVEAFVLPDQDAERDEAYCGRLDMETRMRRRLYEQMVVAGCEKVRKLDGLGVERGAVERKDAVWMALRERGFVEGEVGEVSERWGAEDSFA